jgi:hypothetical protein
MGTIHICHGPLRRASRSLTGASFEVQTPRTDPQPLRVHCLAMPLGLGEVLFSGSSPIS